MSFDDFVDKMLKEILPMVVIFDRSNPSPTDTEQFLAEVALAIHSFYGAELRNIKHVDVESHARSNKAMSPFLNIGFATWKKLMTYLAQVEPPRSLMIILESRAKDLTLSESQVLADARLFAILATTICHIHRLSPQCSKTDQRIVDSNNLALQNAKIYERLPVTTRSIRLVVLRPSIDKDAPIDCVLYNESMNNDPRYEALSYTWGDLAQKRYISVNNNSFAVTENLFVALRHLRSRSQSRVIWIDAICINQNDILERNQQVQQMRDIYRQASEVLIWLGLETDTTATAIDFMTRINWWILGKGLPDIIPYETPLSLLEPVLEINLQREGFRAALLALLEFMKRPWWGRIWVSQEYAMATKVRFLCGRLVMEWPILETFVYVFKYTEPLLCRIVRNKTKSLLPIFDEILRHVGKLFSLVGNRASVQLAIFVREPADINALLNDSRTLESTDPRDRVYALLGMTFESKYGDNALRPNYNLSTKEVYINVATHILCTRQTLDVLVQLCHDAECEAEGEVLRFQSERTRQLPSWVPDWSKRLGSLSVAPSISHNEHQEPLFQAGLDRVSPIPFRFLAQGLVLCVKGVLIDTISLLGPPDLRRLPRVFEIWRRIIPQADDEIYFGNQTVREAFWRTILCDQWEKDKLALHSYSRLGNMIDGHFRFPSCTKKQEARLISLVDDKAIMPQQFRRFFRTERGYFGMAPSLARSGDLVVVLLGGVVPFVLRNSTFIEGTYDYIGDW